MTHQNDPKASNPEDEEPAVGSSSSVTLADEETVSVSDSSSEPADEQSLGEFFVFEDGDRSAHVHRFANFEEVARAVADIHRSGGKVAAVIVGRELNVQMSQVTRLIATVNGYEIEFTADVEQDNPK